MGYGSKIGHGYSIEKHLDFRIGVGSDNSQEEPILGCSNDILFI